MPDSRTGAGPAELAADGTAEQEAEHGSAHDGEASDLEALASGLEALDVPRDVIPKVLAVVQARISHHWAAPPMHPIRDLEELQRLGATDAAERYFRKWEQVTEGNERRADWAAKAHITLRFAGLLSGLTVAVLLIGGSIYVALYGPMSVALALIGVSAAGMVTAFLKWRH